MDGPKDSDSVAAGGVVSRQELFALVWAEPMLKVAKQFGVSSSYMARVCTSMHVPRPERGYWAKLQFGQTLRKPALPAARPGDVLSWGRGQNLIDAPRTVPKAPATGSLPTRKRTRKHGELHPLVWGARALFEAGRVSYWSEYLKPNKKLLLDLVVAKTGLERALSFAEALFWHFEDCGHRVTIAPEHEHFWRAVVDPHEIPKKSNGFDTPSHIWSPRRPTVVYIGSVAIGLTIIELSELADAKSINGGYERLEPSVAQQLKARDRDSWRYTTHDFPSNRVCLQAYSPYRTAEWMKQWREPKGGDLKKQIPTIVEELVNETPAIVQLIEEGERLTALERQKWEEIGSRCVVTVSFLNTRFLAHLFSQPRCSLPIPCPTRPCCVGFLLARKSTVFGIRVPSLTLVMPDHRRKIEPDDNVLRTMLLGFRFLGEGLEAERWHRQRDTHD
jgi:hypothetical protein